MDNIKIALDWTPNINHIGFFVAKELGYYDELGLKVAIVDPREDNYATTPAKKVELGIVDFALCPTESVISFRTKNNPFKLIGVAAILQEDLSAIAVKQDEAINSPKDLDGKTYSSYKARYEDGIVREMIKNDGGKGEINIIYPNKLGIWNTLINGQADATWIFMNWEGVEATQKNYPLKYFKMEEYGIPYSYSPLLVTNENTIPQNITQYKKFITATKKGYLYSQEYSEQSIDILKKYIPDSEKNINLQKALKASARSFGNADNWGKLNQKVVQTFLDWIREKKLETSQLSTPEIITNDLIGHSNNTNA